MPSTMLTLELVDVDGEALGESVDILLRHQTSGTATKVQLEPMVFPVDPVKATGIDPTTSTRFWSRMSCSTLAMS